jgi:hypothetical protein
VRDWLDHADKFIGARFHDEGIVSPDIGQLSYLAETPSVGRLEMEAGFDEALENESPK